MVQHIIIDKDIAKVQEALQAALDSFSPAYVHERCEEALNILAKCQPVSARDQASDEIVKNPD